MIHVTEDTKSDREVTAYITSDSNEGMFYRVQLRKGEWTCTCPQNGLAHKQCKHINSVREYIE